MFPVKKVILIFSIYGILALVFKSAERVEGFGTYSPQIPSIFTDEDRDLLIEDIFNIGHTRFHFGEYDRGNAMMDSAALLQPSKQMYHSKAPGNLLMGNYKEAIATLEKAVEINPGRSLGYRGWAKLFYMRDYKGALKDLQDYDDLREGPDFAFAMNVSMLKGMARQQMGDYDGAIKEFELYINSALEENPDILDVYAYWYRGICYFEKGEIDQALADYDAFLELHPNGPEGHYYKALALIEKASLANSAKIEAPCDHLQKALKSVIKGYTRGFIWNELPNQLYRSDIEDAIEKHCG